VTCRQRTIGRSAGLAGRALFSGDPVRIRVNPAPESSGIAFVRADMPDRPRLPALTDWLTGGARWSGVGRGGVEVRMVEHLLSAAYGLGVDNLEVEVWSDEMPAGDGSAGTYARLLLEAGIVEQRLPRAVLEVRSPVRVQDGDASIEALPHPNGLRITHTLDYGDRFLGRQTLTLDIEPDAFAGQIATARTYVLRPEIDLFIRMGLGKGASLENLIILEEDGSITGERRFADECVRHKIVDLLGDLCLVGRRVNAHVVGLRSGHAANQLLAVELARLAGTA
jgi:UDP-3-O-acyl N-acetylglucosamine deacetylase